MERLNAKCEYVRTEGLFANIAALATNYSLTSIDDILHRDKEIDEYFDFLNNIFRGAAPQNIFIHGKVGVGKSLLTKWVLKSVKDKASELNIELCIIAVNCQGTKTENSMWQTITNQLPVLQFGLWLPLDQGKTKHIGNSIGNHFMNFQNFVNTYPGIIIIVMDEIDHAKNPEIINKIIRLESKLTRFFPCVIGITNNLFIYSKFDKDLMSVLSQQELFIKPYDAEQLQDIIKARIKMAFKPDVIDQNVVGLCAAYAAQEHGEARRAIDLLRLAGQIAEKRQSGIVEEEDVREANLQVEIERVQNAIGTLPQQSKAILLACIFVFKNEKEKNTTSVYEVYKKICVELNYSILTPRRISDLIKELESLGIVYFNVKSKGRYGIKNELIKVEAQEQCLDILYKDDQIKFITEIPAQRFMLLR